MWLENLRELKKKSKMSSKQIAEGTMMPERTVVRIFNGETEHPTITTLIPIVNFLGGSLDEVFADTKAVVGHKDLVDLQENVDIITAELELIKAENAILKEENTAIKAKNELLTMQLMHKEELLALHNYYNKLNQNK